MPSFRIINNISDIVLSNAWKDSAKFNSKDRIVDSSGNRVEANYKGVCYKLIDKKERSYSTFERIERIAAGVMWVLATLGIALLFKCTRQLFTKDACIIRFGLIQDTAESPSTPKKIQKLLIHEGCAESYPCQHQCTVTYDNGQEKLMTLCKFHVKEIINKIPPENITNLWYADHFN